MEQLLLVNPRKRRASGGKKRRSPAQRAATAKMLAANRSKRRSKPASYAANPIKRRRRSTSLTAKHVTRRRRRNPINVGGMTGKISGLLMPALKGAVGAIAVDTLVGYLPLPASLKSGNMLALTRAGAALALGTVGRRLLGNTATQMAVGALTVQAAEQLRNLAARSGLNLGYAGAGMITANVPAVSASPAQVAGMGQYFPRGGRSNSFSFAPAGIGMGEYVN